MAEDGSAEWVVTLRFFTFPEERFAALLAAPKEQARAQAWRLLERMGIAGVEGESPLEAWLRAMCAENGLAWSIPVPDALTECIRSDRAAAQWVWFLA